MTLAPQSTQEDSAPTYVDRLPKFELIILGIALVVAVIFLVIYYVLPIIQNDIVSANSEPASGIVNETSYTIVASNNVSVTKHDGAHVVFYKGFNDQTGSETVKVGFVEANGKEHVFYVPDYKFAVDADNFGRKTYATFRFRKYDPSESLQANITTNLDQMEFSLSSNLWQQLKSPGS